jgi:hypothetical protein
MTTFQKWLLLLHLCNQMRLFQSTPHGDVGQVYLQ